MRRTRGRGWPGGWRIQILEEGGWWGGGCNRGGMAWAGSKVWVEQGEVWMAGEVGGKVLGPDSSSRVAAEPLRLGAW